MCECQLTARNVRQCAVGIFVILASVELVQSFRVHSELPETLENIARGRPTIQSSTEHHYYTRSALAVDGNGKKCAQTQWSSNPWWRVELGKEVWVEKVRIVNPKHKMSNLDIRIGSNRFSHGAFNPLCRQGLMVPSEPCLYSCAEPMLGKLVYIGIQMKATLTLCEVEVFVNNEAKNADWKYLVPVSYGRLLQRASFDRSDQKYVHTSSGRVPWKEIIIDQPPKKGSLQFNDKVIMPVTYKANRNNELIAVCGPQRQETYFNATVISDQKTAGILVKALFKHPSGKPEYQKEKKYHCSWKDLRLKGRDVCKLEVSCPTFSRCSTTYISSSFPPASYYCICNPGYQPSVRRAGNVVLSHEKCVKQNTEPFIRHSKQNLALKMNTEASSTDNYNGCKYKSCQKRPGFRRLAVDGSFHSCFLSLTEHSPWFSVHLNRYHPIALIHVALGERDKRQPKKVYVGNAKAMKNQYSRCAGVETDLKLWSAECRSGKENYMWGNAVKITTDAKILHLCEVQVYAETYGNIALKHITLDAENSLKGSPTTDGILKGRPCLSRRKPYWWVAFGSPVRVTVVFVMHSENSASVGIDITVDIGNGNYKSCASASGYKTAANYFQCKLPLLGSKVHIVSKEKGTFTLCEVEVFQTKTINFAARRPSSASVGANHKSKSKPELGCDQKIDVPFVARSDSGPWWSVDLLVTVDIHLIRIITDAGYDPKDLIDLQVLLDSSKLSHGNSPPGKVVFTLRRPTNDRVQNITLPKGTKGRIVSLRLPGRKEMKFREVEVYNGHMLDVNECSMPDVCPANFECKNTLDSYSCECRGGFKYEIKGKGKAKECVDIDECLARSSCSKDHSYCKNTFGSYRCLCTKGYEGIHDAKMHLNICKDVDECKNASLFNCPERTRCVNTPGGYTCACKLGYEPSPTVQTDGIKIECKDVNECEKRTYSCHANASCTNTIGSYKCICFSGLKGDGRSHCSALDLCTKDKKCSLEHQVCKKVKGVHVCDCTDGFYHSFRQCEDRNECELDQDICGLNSVCTNSKGSYRCSCKPGFKSASGDGKDCTDINECKESRPCGNQAKCENKPGTYKCVCRDGYAFHAEVKKCLDVNECEEKGKCGPNTNCHNAPGTYSCSCQKGFVTGEHKLNCTDVDECFNNNYDCDSRSYCVNIPGSYDCQCKEGYTKNLKNKCEEECTEDCPLNSMCVNGRCYCLPGYVFGPYKECYKESFLLTHASGMSLRSAVLLIVAALLGCLIL